MAQEGYGTTQPLYDWTRKYVVDPVNTVMRWAGKVPVGKSDTSSTDSGKLPAEWEKANEESIKQQLAGKSASGPKVAGGARKRTEIQKKATRKAPAKKITVKR